MPTLRDIIEGVLVDHTFNDTGCIGHPCNVVGLGGEEEVVVVQEVVEEWGESGGVWWGRGGGRKGWKGVVEAMYRNGGMIR